MPTDRDILARISSQPNQAVGFKQLVREMGLRGGEDRRDLEARLQKLVDRGELVATGRDRFALPKAAAKHNLVAGELSMHRDGYGFVTPRDPAVRDKIAGDVYISPREIGHAMHGDQVLVELGTGRGDGRADGRIVKVIGRAHPTVVGLFHYGDRYNYIQPIDDKLSDPVVIPHGMEVPKLEMGHAPPLPGAPPRDSRHRVIGKEARRSQHTDLEGMVVDVEIIQWPSGTQNARGKVIEVLGYEDDFGVDVEIIIRKHHIPHVFPTQVLQEAEATTAVLHRDEIAQRQDYRDLPIVTIDGETARDFDDAVLVRKLENGNHELQVHIADVANYVREGSAIDGEARLRGTSVYFPDRAVPMLPLELSTDLCSLRPQVERLVLSCVMEIDHAGEVVGYDVHEGVIRSAARMTYNEVQAILDGDHSMRQQYARLVSEFEGMEQLAKILNRKRVKRGSIDFDMPEPVIEFDEAGLMLGVSRSERKFSHRIIEEFMLAANECVAEYLESRNIASLFRIHEKPDAKKVYDFELLAASFGYSLGVGALPIKRFQTRGERRERHGSGRNPREHEIPEDVHITPRMYQKLTQKLAGKPEERIVSYLMLRSLKQARYSEINEGHFALATATYTHFTSPIRRYPDLIVHRILKQVLNGGTHSESQSTHAPRGSGRRHTPTAAKSESVGDAVRPGLSQEHNELSPWSKRRDERAPKEVKKHLTEIIPIDELHDIAVDSSATERRADEAERELMEWKKTKFMEAHVGDDFSALVVSVTKYGLFVELDDLFIEGLVPIATLTGDRYTYRENTRQIIGERSGHAYSIGDRVRVLLDRVDRVQRKLQFSILEERPANERARRARR